MTTRLSTFKSIMSPLGFAPSNRFSLLITPPPGLTGGLGDKLPGLGGMIIGEVISTVIDNVAEQLLSFACHKVNTNLGAFDTVSTNVNGLIEHRAGPVDFDTLNVEFYVDSQHVIREFFMSWFNLIRNSRNKASSYPRDYMSAQSSLIIYDNANQSLSPTQDIIFENLWPVELGELSFDWSDANTPLTLPVTFRYDNLTSAWQRDLLKSMTSRGIRSVINKLPGGGLFG